MDEYWITEAMIRMGGSFVQQLGHLYRLADNDNQELIRNTWDVYWNVYKGYALEFHEEWSVE